MANADDADRPHRIESQSTPTEAERRTPPEIETRPLPSEVARELQALFGTDDRPETFGAWVQTLADTFDDWPPSVDDLCHDSEGIHRADTEDGETYRFTCVLDAFLLPFLTDGPVEVESVDPKNGETVRARVSQNGIETTPADAVMSFGLSTDVENLDPSPETMYGSTCPYIHAFADSESYERWAAVSDGVTTPLSLDEGLALARVMVEA